MIPIMYIYYPNTNPSVLSREGGAVEAKGFLDIKMSYMHVGEILAYVYILEDNHPI